MTWAMCSAGDYYPYGPQLCVVLRSLSVFRECNACVDRPVFIGKVVCPYRPRCVRRVHGTELTADATVVPGFLPLHERCPCATHVLSLVLCVFGKIHNNKSSTVVI